MTISEIMTADAQCIDPDTTLTDAAKRLRDLDVGALPVCENDRVVGMITDRDLAVRGMAEECSPDMTTVRDIMTSGIVYAYDDQDVEAAAQIMERRQIRRLPIMNRSKRLVGIVSLGDIAEECAEPALCGRALKGISHPPSDDSEFVRPQPENLV